jgi:succinyl-diaminopimelate desuccinylase
MKLPTDPIENLATLIRCPSVTPAEGGALSALEAMLVPLGFSVERPAFSEAGTADVENLYARRFGEGRHLMFAGHTDVVPPGNPSDWTHPPFAAEIHDGEIYGRGAADMKGGIACFVAAAARQIERTGGLGGSLSMLITGDEEAAAINGTVKLLAWAAARGETWDAALVGEPTNPERLGEMIKIGRRGSLSGVVTVQGRQGHTAYPHQADNPVHGIVTLAAALLHPPFDEGTRDFQATNLEITSIDVGNAATNVIPSAATLAFNIRFNELWTAESLKDEVRDRLDRASPDDRFRENHPGPIAFELRWPYRASPVFLTRNDGLVGTLSGSIEAITGLKPVLSTSGGTSDARFIKDYCPVVEFGLTSRSIHMVDERAALTDLETLTEIYRRFLADWFGRS